MEVERREDASSCLCLYSSRLGDTGQIDKPSTSSPASQYQPGSQQVLIMSQMAYSISRCHNTTKLAAAASKTPRHTLVALVLDRTMNYNFCCQHNTTVQLLVHDGPKTQALGWRDILGLIRGCLIVHMRPYMALRCNQAQFGCLSVFGPHFGCSVVSIGSVLQYLF